MTELTAEQERLLSERVAELVKEGIPEIDACFIAAIELGIIDIDEEGVDYMTVPETAPSWVPQ